MEEEYWEHDNEAGPVEQINNGAPDGDPAAASWPSAGEGAQDGGQ